MKKLQIDTTSSDFDVRYMTESDGPFLKECLKNRDVLAYLPICDEKEAALFFKVWKSYSQYRCCLTAIWKGKPCGMGILYLMPYRKTAHRGLMQAVVPPLYRGMEVEDSLVKNLAHLGKSYFRLEWVQIEVEEGSWLIPALEQNEFTVLLQQERYFKADGKYKARLIYERDLRDG